MKSKNSGFNNIASMDSLLIFLLTFFSGQLSPATPGMLMDCSILKLGNRITDIQKLLPISFNVINYPVIINQTDMIFQVSRIHLDHNNVTSLDLGWIENYPQLLTISLVHNHVKTLSNSR